MPQMSPSLWFSIIIFSISLLFSTSSFLYFMFIPSPSLYLSYLPSTLKPMYFNWQW